MLQPTSKTEKKRIETIETAHRRGDRISGRVCLQATLLCSGVLYQDSSRSQVWQNGEEKNKKTLYTSVRPGRILSAGYMSWSVHTKSGSQVSQTVTKGLRLVRGCPRTSSSHLTPDGTGRAYFLHGLVKSWESKATLTCVSQGDCLFVCLGNALGEKVICLAYNLPHSRVVLSQSPPLIGRKKVACMDQYPTIHGVGNGI